MTVDEAIKRYINNSEYERTHGSLQGCLEFKQLVEWLKELKDYRERIPSYETGYNDAKREIAISGEYERAYERGRSDAEPNKWSPVSERLPEDFQRVLVTIVNYKGDKVVRAAEYYNYNNRKGIFRVYETHENWVVGEKGLLAWLPLPKPYEPQESEVEDENDDT